MEANTRGVLWWGAGHLIIDFACAFVVVTLPGLGLIGNYGYFTLVLSYNVIAFGCQPFLGRLLDHLAAHRLGMTCGFAVCAFGAAVAQVEPIIAVILLGLGNALFHVGGGALVFYMAPGRASIQGLFVAPGGIGLATGLYLGLIGRVNLLWLAALLGFGTMLLHLYSPNPDRPPDAGAHSSNLQLSPLAVISILLILLVVGLRSFLGFAMPAPWKSVPASMMILVLTACLGKSVGGVLADRLGWRRFCVAMLTVAAVPATLYGDSLLAACVAIFCLQTTTGVTLAAIQSRLPGRPAFAFGLPCLALLLGAAPFLTGQPALLVQPGLALLLCTVVLLALYNTLPHSRTKEPKCPSQESAAPLSP